MKQPTSLKFRIIKMLRTFAFMGLTSATSLFMVSSVSAATCSDLVDNKSYDEALPICLAEKSYFAVGYIYGEKADCSNMEKYYRLEGSAGAKGNLGVAFVYGFAGCTKAVLKGVSLLKEAVNAGNPGYAKDLGDHYRKEGKTKLATEYYTKAINNTDPFEWSLRRARRSYEELIMLLDAKALKALHLNNLIPKEEANETELSSSFLNRFTTTHPEISNWRNELAQRASEYLQSNLNITERLDVFFKSGLSSEIRCDWGEKLYQNSFQELVNILKNQGSFERFADNLCNGGKEYFVAQTYENGFGNKEDFQAAYRLYLIAGAQGNTSAKAARERIRDQLSPEQVAEAVCLADYGIEPAYYQKLLCKF
jgi:TPR repeat protein